MDKRIIFVNDAFEKLTGYSKKELFNKSIIYYIHPEHTDKMERAWRYVFEGVPVKDAKFKIICKDQEVRWFLSSWDLVRDTCGNRLGVLGHQQEITGRVNSGKEKQKIYKEKFGESNAIHEIIHDMRSPLATITGFIALIEDRPCLSLGKLEQYLNNINASASELKIICNEVLVFYNINKKK